MNGEPYVTIQKVGRWTYHLTVEHVGRPVNPVHGYRDKVVYGSRLRANRAAFRLIEKERAPETDRWHVRYVHPSGAIHSEPPEQT